MTIADKLFVKILSDRDSRTLIQINPEWLEGEEVARYNFISSYFKKYLELPTLTLFKDRFKIKIEEVEDSAEYFLDELKNRFVHISLVDQVPRLIKASKKDSFGSLDKLRDIISKLYRNKDAGNVVSYGADAEDRFAKYVERIEKGGVMYLPTGDDFFTSFLYGYSDVDLITIGGRPGTKKTWIIIYLCLVLDKLIKEHLKDRPILFISNEIGEDELKGRMDCMKYKLNYTNFLKGDLSVKEQARYERGLKHKSSSSVKLVNGCKTIKDLEVLISLYNPGAVFLDGSYLMEPQMPMSWEKISYITQNLKALNLAYKTPIINTTQSRRRSGGTPKSAISAQDEFAFADSYSQDSDVAMVIVADADSAWHDSLTAVTAKGRSVDLTKGTFTIDAPLNSMKFKFTNLRDPEPEDLEPETIDY